MESTAAVLTALGRLQEALSCLYLAREAMSLERLEDEIGMVKGLMEKRGIPIPQERAPRIEHFRESFRGKSDIIKKIIHEGLLSAS